MPRPSAFHPAHTRPILTPFEERAAVAGVTGVATADVSVDVTWQNGHVCQHPRHQSYERRLELNVAVCNGRRENDIVAAAA